MKEKKDNLIAARLDISNKIGLGHYSRLKNLEGKFSNLRLIWIISGEKNLVKKILHRKKFIFFANDKNHNKTLRYLKKNSIRKIILDVSHNLNMRSSKIFDIQKKYLKNNIKLISFDDPRHKIISDISIIPYDYQRNKIQILNKATKLYLGPNYQLLSKNFDKIAKRSAKFIKKINKILICTSGSDSFNLNLRILKIIYENNYKFEVLLSSKKSNFFKKKISNVKFFNFDNYFYKRIFLNDIAIIGEGITKYETSFLGKNHIIISSNKLNQKLMKHYISHKNCLYLNNFNNSRKDEIKKKIKDYIVNHNLRYSHYLNTIKKYNFNNNIKKVNILFKAIKDL